MTPHVSVIIATRNRRVCLARAFASLDAQRFRDFEVVVVDDGSTDGTPDWLGRQRPTARLVALTDAAGAAGARNHGVVHARGDVLAFLDDDDRWRPGYLETQAARCNRQPHAICTTGHVEIDSQGRQSHPDLRPAAGYSNAMVHMLAECPIHTLSVVACHRHVWHRVGPFDPRLSIVHDLDWYARALAHGVGQDHVADALVERGVPGGLVSRHREWYAQERALHERLVETHAMARRDRRTVRAARALLFARVGAAKGDAVFAAARAAEAIWAAPIVSARLAARRVWRRVPRAGMEAWSERTSEAE